MLLKDTIFRGAFDDSDHQPPRLSMTVFKFQNLKILNLNYLKTEPKMMWNKLSANKYDTCEKVHSPKYS